MLNSVADKVDFIRMVLAHFPQYMIRSPDFFPKDVARSSIFKIINHMVQYIITDIMDLAENHIVEEGRNEILPRDIALVIFHDADLKRVLGITRGTKRAEELKEMAFSNENNLPKVLMGPQPSIKIKALPKKPKPSPPPKSGYKKFRDELFSNMGFAYNQENEEMARELYYNADPDMAKTYLDISRGFAKTQRKLDLDKEIEAEARKAEKELKRQKKLEKQRREREEEEFFSVSEDEDEKTMAVYRALEEEEEQKTRSTRSKPQANIRLDLTQKGKIIKLPTTTSTTGSGNGRVKKGLMWR